MQQAGKRWFTSESSHAVDRIRQAAAVEDKQLALDAYMGKKINAGRYSTPQHNAVILQRKLEQLHLQLCPQDAEQVMARVLHPAYGGSVHSESTGEGMD